MRFIFVSHVRRSQNIKHAKVLSYFINKWKTRFDFRKPLNKNISLKTIFFFFFWLNKKIFFIRKKIRLNIKIFKHKYILIKYKYIFFEWQNSYKTKIYFWLNINIYGFLDKKILNIKMYFCNISATIHSL